MSRPAVYLANRYVANKNATIVVPILDPDRSAMDLTSKTVTAFVDPPTGSGFAPTPTVPTPTNGEVFVPITSAQLTAGNVADKEWYVEVYVDGEVAERYAFFVDAALA